VEKHFPWTPTIQTRFLEALADTGNVRHAALHIKRSPTTVYKHRQRDPAFAAAWDAALNSAMDTVLEVEAIRRAVEGVEQPVYYQGAQVGTRREYSDTLLIFLLKGWKPERYKDRHEVVHAGSLALLRKMEQIGKMSPDELTAFLQDVERHVNALEPEERR
jgi:hypothetical protein